MVKLVNILVSVILVSMIALGFGAFLTNTAEQYAVTGIDSGFETTFDNLQNITSTTEDVRTKIESAELLSVDGFAALFSGAYSILRIVMSIIFLPINIIIDIGLALGLPAWFSTGVTAAIILIVAFAIANIVFGRGRA